MKSARSIVPVTAAALALGLVVAGCGKDDSKSESSSASSTSATSAAASATSTETSAAPASKDYTTLLMKPEDIPPTPDGPFVAAEDPKLSTTPPPTDVSRIYTSGPNVINASVVINDSAAAAATWLGGVAASLPTHQTGTPVPVPSVTPDAMLTTGTDPENKHASSALLFTVDNYSSMILFVSPDGDLTPVPQDYVESVGKAQVAAIQAAAPALK
ncbi:hypothetical protein FHT44_004423 [Mycolicibacterium sp. BK634]|uniref:hypothetical protein n=1 Tax=Mycolicibacterium sp. BK634 TaxID=2587099 RepID=UPI001613CBB6|nr:hypothetical protein [Mycolicibacterium sp. BK634]MBB3751928.1 hypothetical protein [Mycolicibacterium sp. BK634]